MTGQGDFFYLNCSIDAEEVNLGAQKPAFSKQTNNPKRGKNKAKQKQTQTLNYFIVIREAEEMLSCMLFWYVYT